MTQQWKPVTQTIVNNPWYKPGDFPALNQNNVKQYLTSQQYPLNTDYSLYTQYPLNNLCTTGQNLIVQNNDKQILPNLDKQNQGLLKTELSNSTNPNIINPVELPKTDVPKQEPPKTDVPKQEPPKTDVPKTDVPKQEPPKTDIPKQELPKTDIPKTDVPTYYGQKQETQSVPGSWNYIAPIKSQSSNSPVKEKEGTIPLLMPPTGDGYIEYIAMKKFGNIDMIIDATGIGWPYGDSYKTYITNKITEKLEECGYTSHNNNTDTIVKIRFLENILNIAYLRFLYHDLGREMIKQFKGLTQTGLVNAPDIGKYVTSICDIVLAQLAKCNVFDLSFGKIKTMLIEALPKDVQVYF
jgi:hypothetical protein